LQSHVMDKTAIVGAICNPPRAGSQVFCVLARGLAE